MYRALKGRLHSLCMLSICEELPCDKNRNVLASDTAHRALKTLYHHTMMSKDDNTWLTPPVEEGLVANSDGVQVKRAGVVHKAGQEWVDGVRV